MRSRSAGFTLIELMIVVAIIGILAAIAVPNFLRFALRAKSAEGKATLAAIRTAEEAYYAEFSVYLSCQDSPPAWTTGPAATIKVPWVDAGGFAALGWSPEGDVYFQYHVEDPGGAGVEFLAEARSDLDGDAVTQIWGYVRPPAGQAAATADGSWGCPAAGVVVTGGTGVGIVGSCCAGCGASIF
jgi:type IV pilus assembly protein PilA